MCEYNATLCANSSRLPADCDAKELLNCSRSWRSGIPQGSTSRAPIVYEFFTLCHLERGQTLCGYVSVNEEDGQIMDETEGVVVGPEVDLGVHSNDSLSQLGLPRDLISTLKPYLGLRGADAACALINQPLMLSNAETNALTDAVFDATITRAEELYEKIRIKDPVTSTFSSLSRGIRTALVDISFQFKSPLRVQDLPTFWFFVATNDWRRAAEELRSIAQTTTNPFITERLRLNNVADIIQATVTECSRPSDIVFLLDESGSVASSDFALGVDFIGSIIDSFDNVGSGPLQTRFGLSLFATNYRPFFFLSTYSTKSDYLSALASVSQSAGSTFLGDALNGLAQDQLTEARGLRPEEDGIQRLVIVLTDGLSHDSVSTPAANVRTNRNTAIYAIGIGNYNLAQLHSIVSHPIEYHTLLLDDFDELTDFVGDLVASTCNEPRPVLQNVVLTGTVVQGSTQFYVFDASGGDNLQINIDDIAGHTVVYASTENPHPNEFDNDFSFVSSTTLESKIIVVSDELFDEEATDMLLFVSVTSKGRTASYTIESFTCDPLRCSAGTSVVDLSMSDSCTN